MNTVYGQQGPTTDDSDYNVMAFVVQQLLQKVQTVTLVKVMAVRNAGGIAPVGTIDVTPLVNIMTGNRQPIPHGIIYNIPYFRMQGGANAIILDPQVGDIGMCAFCSRDISAVKATKAAANPGSFRLFDWADGLYFGGMLNAVPTQYVAFAAGGITLHSPVKITLSAPVIDIEAGTIITLNSPLNDIKGGGSKIDGKPFLPHTHTSESPGTPTGPVL